MTDRGAEAIAIDISEQFVPAAAEAAGPGIDHIIGDGAEPPFASSAFDAAQRLEASDGMPNDRR